jgi:hypothetical protein
MAVYHFFKQCLTRSTLVFFEYLNFFMKRIIKFLAGAIFILAMISSCKKEILSDNAEDAFLNNSTAKEKLANPPYCKNNS